MSKSMTRCDCPGAGHDPRLCVSTDGLCRRSSTKSSRICGLHIVHVWPHSWEPDYVEPFEDRRERLETLIKHETGCSEVIARRAVRAFGTDLKRAERNASKVASLMHLKERELQSRSLG